MKVSLDLFYSVCAYTCFDLSIYMTIGFNWIRNFRTYAASAPISQDFDIYISGLVSPIK